MVVNFILDLVLFSLRIETFEPIQNIDTSFQGFISVKIEKNIIKNMENSKKE